MSSASVGEGEEDVRRVFFEDEEVSWAALEEMCARRAVEALWSWGRLDMRVWRGCGGSLEIDPAGRASRIGLALSVRLILVPFAGI